MERGTNECLFVSSIRFSIAFSIMKTFVVETHISTVLENIITQTNCIYHFKRKWLVLFYLAVPMPDMCGKLIAE